MTQNSFGYILNSKITATSYNDTISQIEGWIKTNEKHKYICICNTHSLVTASKDADFNKVLDNANICTPDGMPLVWALRMLGYKEQERVDGPNLMLKLNEVSAKKGYKVYLYGGTEEVLERLEAKLTELYKGIKIVGKYSPPFRDLSEKEELGICEMINNTQPDITFISLGCPKQEKWMHRNTKNINSVLIGVGAAFNYTIGDIKRAPLFFQKIGMEWFFRFIMEPRRLWRRYFYNNSVFIYEFIKTHKKNKYRTMKLNHKIVNNK